MNDLAPIVAVAVSSLTLILLIVEKVFGGGNALANKFHALEKETGLALAAVRNELVTKVIEYEKQGSVGFDTARSGITEIRMGLLELRAHTSESLHAYIRKDDYNAGISEIKRDVREGFERVDNRLGQLQDLVTWHNRSETNEPGGR